MKRISIGKDRGCATQVLTHTRPSHIGIRCINTLAIDPWLTILPVDIFTQELQVKFLRS
ncbi:hypothetical protein SAMN05216387_102221 [Nitrosovibrio tenuis]|uniref:Uncharacterized protein n=1 Tax=Nitrosovibrio tenuis TaxID=1233 RepID=A0A1H7IM28_9PROT|nr:hypothetical protein SAMN05216387_102221 [Nitrosovibrio tenuis]